ncbi:Nitrilotriacetate monooxygenase component A [Caballeronia sordidicola]|uniref:Nitrilotriacetate monooxygenase component A n=2 Tax=Caballeronia sordidicola TaxID=196367 RepID=A0A242MUZ5_CABSO|nr:Nitrilotriacetate monooxygenase component A [Caballeronia sordidicola]
MNHVPASLEQKTKDAGASQSTLERSFMTTQRRLRLGAFMRPATIHTGAWRYPGAFPDANFNFAHLKRFAQTLERGRFDAFFMADHLAVLNMPTQALRRSHTATSFEPLTLLSALAAVTEHIGLIATASTTFEEPYHVARRFASLDHLSGGRAGWNLVTTANPDAALNFGLDEHVEHGERYKRGREFFDVVTGLWDSWADDAFVRDVESGTFFDPAKMHVLNHKGKSLSVRGPLNIARPVQGWPVIVQAGSSEAGRQVAAETAEAVFAAPKTLAEGQRFYADVKGRMARLGRDPEHLKILPAAFVVIGDSLEEAQEKRALLDTFVHYDSGIASLCIMLGHDVSGFDPDGPLPEIPETNASKSSRERVIEWAARDNLTIRQLAQRVGGYSGLEMVGTPSMIADQMEQWLVEAGSDGFNVMFPYLPGGLDDFVDKVVPELQSRGIFRREYEGRTLRENLGLPRPENRFFNAGA